jgi:DNA-directed RNA polymerase specialized sigma24 family protein
MGAENRTPPPHVVTHEDVQTARAFVRAAGARAEEVDDIVQEALCALAFRRSPLETPGGRSPDEARRAFLRGVVARQVADHLRRRARRCKLQALCAQAFSGEPVLSPEEIGSASWAGVLPRVRRHLKAAAPELHALFEALLRGGNVATFAVEARIAVGTAWSRWRRLREEVRAFFAREEAGCRRLAR